VAKIPRKTDSAGVLSLLGYRFMVRGCIRQKVVITMSEKNGIYAVTFDGKKHEMQLLETNSSTTHMPEVQKLLINEYFLKDTKAKYREVYREAG
jgi:hypothetical protein